MGKNVVKLGELCEILDSKRKPVTKKDRVAGEYPYYGATGVQDYVADYIFDEKLVLVGEDGAKWGAGENTAYAISGKCWVNNHAHVLKPNRNKVLDNYIIYYLNQLDLRPYITGAIIEKLNQEQLRNILIPLPTIEEQNRIVTLMDKADEIRAKKKLANDKLDEFLKSTFISMFGDPRTNNHNWNTEKFNEMCEISSTTVMPNTQDYCNMLHIGGANIESNTGKLINLKTAKEEGLTSVKFLIHPDHILFSKIRPKLRKVAMPKMHALCSADIYPLLPIRDKCVKEYLLYILRTEYFSRIVSDMAESRSNIPKVNREELAQIYLMCPPLDLQNKFAEIVEKVEAQKQKNEFVIEQMNNLFNSLSQRAFKGEL